ncbi:MAG: hypothetical protein CUN49_04865 [Candidatus Thermofonsia Clade 1 bacterium]|jgi:hypothetical protein|uniref:ParB-like N-terminal domain-containing protein n=1 Tax=Candidatus Thermofonsia Clade 1 bacterium TaxID=2364210 RepID=A0A2M8PG72_9CHLR|nr:MAG: hypothetical protein CUN49_04865 [Candidatus Thermofonsia Clade 1 bacterium]RMF51043.1 MAG: hypothetical protein D6749_08895 [Chloroflexota bacterium]
MDPDDPTAVAQSARHFSQARMKAFWQEVWALLTGKSIDLLRFEEVKQRLRLTDERYLGLREIPLDKIVGSVGRYRDFTRTFLPRTNAVRSRWQRLDALARGAEGFPPIEVYKVGDAYFVIDGNHRVSVARQLGAKTIEAYVTELRTPVPIDENTTEKDLIQKEAYADFLRRTRLDVLRPEAQIILTEPDRYNQLLEHISVHRYFMGIDQKREVSWEEAVCSWYDNVYLPLVKLIREYGVLEYFPGRTEADLYAWLIKHQEAMRLYHGGEYMTPQETVKDFLSKLPEARRG